MSRQDAPPGGGSPEQSVSLLRVAVAGRHLALPLDGVLQIHAAVQVAPLPGAPACVAGLVNRHGRPLPVLDLRRRLGLPAEPVRASDHLVVLQLPAQEVGVLVEQAVDVLEVLAASVHEAAAVTPEAVLGRGVAVLPDGLLVVLDLAALLSAEESELVDEAMRQALLAAAP